MDLKQEIGNRLKQFREGLGLSQKEITSGLSIKPGVWSNYEKGISAPSINVLSELSTLYSLDLNWLITGSRIPRKKIEKMDDFIETFFLLPEGLNIEEIEDPETNLERYIEKVEDLTGEPFDEGLIYGGLPKSANIPALFYRDAQKNEFIRSYKRMNQLHSQGVLDDEMLELWKEKEIKKYRQQ